MDVVVVGVVVVGTSCSSHLIKNPFKAIVSSVLKMTIKRLPAISKVFASTVPLSSASTLSAIGSKIYSKIINLDYSPI